jgi:hypothetical protein
MVNMFTRSIKYKALLLSWMVMLISGLSIAQVTVEITHPGQANPTNVSPIVFQAVFSEAVSGFDESDVVLSASTAPGTLLASVLEINPSTYSISVSGMTGTGDVIITIPAGAATAVAAPPDRENIASTNTDNTVTYDVTNPRISSIVRQSPTTSPTNADVLVWDVTFDEAVLNVDAADFTITGTTATIQSVTNPAGNTYRINVSGGDLASLNGTVTLNFSGGQNITDLAGNALSNTTPTGTNDNTFVVDNTAPLVSSITRQSPTTSPTNADVLVWDVTFNEAVLNVDAADFTITGTTATIQSVTNPAGNTYRINVSGGDLASLNGTVILNFSGGQNITDLAGNALSNTTPTGTNDNTFVVDNTAPVFSGTTPITGAFVNHTQVSYTLSENLASGSITWTRTGGTADPGSPRVQALTGSELLAGTKTNITLTNNPAIVSGAIYSISFNGTDLAGNVATTVTNTNITFDNTPPVFSGTAPTTGSFVNHTQVSYTLSENLTSGSITWTRTGGSADGSSPHIQALTGSELTAGTKTNITLTNNPTLVDGTVYSIAFNGTDNAGNAASTVTNTNITYDITPPAAPTSHTVATTGGLVRSAFWNGSNTGVALTIGIPNDASLVNGTVVLEASSNGITWNPITSTSSTTISAVNTTKVMNITAAQITAIADYAQGVSLRFRARLIDAAGNTNVANVTAGTPLLLVDTIAPTVVSSTFNANGSSRETINLTFSETLDKTTGLPVSTTTLGNNGFYTNQPQIRTSGSTAFTVSGVTLQSNSNGQWNSNVEVTYTKSASTDGALNYVRDLAGNEMETVTFPMGTLAAPQLASGMILFPNGTSPETIVFFVDQPLNTSTFADAVTGLTVNGAPFPGTYNSSNNSITITSALNGQWDHTATVSYSSGNLAGSTGTPMGAFSNVPILVGPLTISSNNANPLYGKVGDQLSLAFTVNKTLTPNAEVGPPLTVTIGGLAASLSGVHPNYTASATATAAIPDGNVNFTITIVDGETITNVTATIPGSTVTFDKTPPVISPVSISSNNTDPAFAKPGDVVTLNFSVNETLTATPTVTIDGKAVSISNVGLSYTATAVLDASYTEGILPFSITVLDLASNQTIRTTTTNASSVTFDKTPPTVTSITLNNSIINTYAASINGTTPTLHGNEVDYLITFSEPVNGVSFSSISGEIVPNSEVNPGFPPISAAYGSITPVTAGGTATTAPSQYWKFVASYSSGTGTLKININNDINIIDRASLTITGTPFTSGPAYTISLPQPGSPVAALNPTTVSEGSITVNWADVAGATNYLVTLRSSATPPTIQDGTFIPNNSDFGDGVLVQNIAQGVQTATFTQAPAGTPYHIFIYPYALSPNTTSVNTTAIDFNTTPAILSRASDLIKEATFSYPTNIDYASANNQTLDISPTTGIALERFTLRDGGASADADNHPTVLSGLTLKITNYQYLRKIALYEVGPGPGFVLNNEMIERAVATSVSNVVGNTADIVFSGLNFTATDNGTNNFIVKVSFNNTGIVDNEVISFQVTQVAAGTNSSLFATSVPVGIQSNPTADQNKIEVTATVLDFTSIPASTSIGVDFSPIVVEARDAFGNRDLDFTSVISAFSNTRSLSYINGPTISTSNFNTPSPGVYTFPSNFQFTSSPDPVNPPTTLQITAGGISGTSPGIGVVASTESSIEIVQASLIDRIPYLNFQAGTIPDVAGSFPLATYRITDGDGVNPDVDGAATSINTIQFELSTTDNLGNTVLGAKDIRQIALFNQAGVKLDEQTLGSNTTVSFTIGNPADLSAPDNSSTTFTLRATFNNTAADVRDLNNIKAKIINVTQHPGSELNQSVASVTNGLWSKATGAVLNAVQTPANRNIINVIATRLDFTTQPPQFAGINEPFGSTANPTIPVIQARDINQIIDLEHNFAADLGAPGASLTPATVNFVEGYVDLENVQYITAGEGTITVTSNGLSSNAPSISSTRVDVLHVTATAATGGVSTSTNLPGGALSRVIFGVTFNAPHKITTPSNEPLLEEFTITFSNPITNVFTDIRVFESKITSYSANAAVNVLSPSIGGQLIIGNDFVTVDLSNIPRDLTDPENATLTYFLMVSVSESASGNTPEIQPQLIDLGYTDPDTNDNIIISNGSSLANVSGLTYSFASIFPPTLVSSQPLNGQLNVDPNQPEISLLFSVPVTTLDGVIRLHDKDAGTFTILNAINGITGVENPIRFAIPPGTMAPDKVYYITIAPGNTTNNTGLKDDADNLFPGISFSGTLFFKTANPNPPVMLTASTPGITNPSITNITVSGAVINATFDQRGKAYFLVLPSGSPAPTNDQIKGSVAYVGFIDRGSFDINQTSPISQFGLINADLTTSTTYNVWLYAENDALPAPIPTASPYGSLANNHQAGTAGPTFTFTTPATVNTNITLNVPNINICSNSFQLLNAPIIISEGNMGNFNTNGNVVAFNLLLPAGFEFDISLNGSQPAYGELILFGDDFNVSQPSTKLSFIGTGILRIQYANNGSSSRDKIIITGLRIRGTSSGGSMVRLGGDALPSIPDLSPFVNLSTSDAQGIIFSNSYTDFVFPGQPIVTFIPDNFNAPSNIVELIPLPPPGDFGQSRFSGQGVNVNLLNLSAVNLDQPFNITVTHTDNNGCVSTASEQYTVYDHTNAIPDLEILYCSVNENFPAAASVDSNLRLIRYNTRPTYYMFDLKTDIPIAATASSQIMFGNAWKAVLQNLLSSTLVTPAPADDPSQGTIQYFNYEWDEALILNFSDPGNDITSPYDYFEDFSPQGNRYIRGGSLGFVEFSGRFQNIANSALQIPLTQNVEIFIPAVPIVEVGRINLANAQLNNNVFCEDGGTITINGYPAATVGVSVGKFRLYDATSNTLITDNNTNYFTDNGNGTATFNPDLFQNSYQNIRIEYTYKDNNSPCESSGNLVINIAPNPTAAFVMRSIIGANTPNETSYCEDRAIEFSAETSSIAVGTIEAFAWNFNDATNSTFANPNTLQGTRTNGFDKALHTYIQTAEYNPSLIVTSAVGCSSTSSSSPLRIGTIPSVNFSFNGVSVNDVFNFINETVIPAGTVADGLAQLAWTFGNGNTATVLANFNDPVTNNYNTPGPLTANLQVTSLIGCRNSLNKTLIVLPKYTPTPEVAYLESFENNNGGWQHAATANSASGSSWAYGEVNKEFMQLGPDNGSKVWATSLTGKYNPRERSALYSPSFDISALTRPMVSFNSFVHMDNSDGVIIQYSVDNLNVADPNKQWHVLGEGLGEGVDWFNEQGIAAKPGGQLTRDFAWTGLNSTEWLESKHAITNDPTQVKPEIVGETNVVFRFALGSARDIVNGDGFAIDNFRIGNRTRTVLIENFSNTSQANNTKAQADFLKGFNSGSAVVELVKVNYHVAFPGPDPINQRNPNDPGARALYYNISQTPRARLDGQTVETAQNPFFSQWGELEFSKQTLQQADASIEINAGLNTDGEIEIRVSAIPVVDLPAGTTLHVAILDEQVILNTFGVTSVPSGETDFEYVLNKMLPSAAGTKSNTVLPSGIQLNYGPFKWNPRSTDVELVVVAFLQNESTNPNNQDVRKVYQAEILKQSLSGLPLITSIESAGFGNKTLGLFPNPADKVLHVQFSESMGEDVRVNLMDQMGKMLQQTGINAGEKSVSIDTENYAAGLYFIQIETKSGEVIRQKIIIVH